MNNFTWSQFGILADVSKTDSMVIIRNEQGAVRKMSLNKYKQSALAVYKKALAMKGQKVEIRTSQNTNNWSTSEWFSDIAHSNIAKSPNPTLGLNQAKQTTLGKIELNKTYKVSNRDVKVTQEGEHFIVDLVTHKEKVLVANAKKSGLSAAIKTVWISAMVAELERQLSPQPTAPTPAKSKVNWNQRPDDDDGHKNERWNDYSNSPVEGDLGYINTRFWNGR